MSKTLRNKRKPLPLMHTIKWYIGWLTPVFAYMLLCALLVFISFSIAGCTTYIRKIPTFPEAKILKVYFPFEVEPNEIAEWTVWANSATDSLKVESYYNSGLSADRDILLTQKSKFNHGNAPVSGVQGSWYANMAGKYQLTITGSNRWTQDVVHRFIDVKTTTLYEY